MRILGFVLLLVWLALGPGGLVYCFIELGQRQRNPDLKGLFLMSGAITVMGGVLFWFLT